MRIINDVLQNEPQAYPDGDNYFLPRFTVDYVGRSNYEHI